MVARAPGAAGPEVVNDPSDGAPRPVPNGLGLVTVGGSGVPAGVRVAPAGSAVPGTAVDTVGPGEGLDRVFPGLRRTVAASPYDETFAPAAADLRWRVRPASVARVSPGAEPGTAVMTGRRPGTADLVVRTRGPRGGAPVTGTLPVQVLGELQRLAVEPGEVALDGAGSSAPVTVVGYDADGFRAPVEPADVDLVVDESVVTVAPAGTGFVLTAVADAAATVVQARVGDVVTYLPVTTGLVPVDVEGFDLGGTVGDWYAFDIGAPGARLSPVPGSDGTPDSALRLDYDFTGPRSTRAAYIAAPGAALPLPGEPRRISLSVDGDGNGAWLRASIQDADGTRHTVNLTDQASGVDWTGWRTVTADVPAGVRYPLQLRLVYPVETVAAERYTGSIAIDDLAVEVAQSVEVPEVPEVRDPLVLDGDALPHRGWSFAVMNDSQFTAAGGEDSPLVRETRRALREIVASDADFLVINGDFVDTSYPEDFALARRILDEEVGDALPVYYQPGNHEILGTARIDEFVDAFGETRRTFDHRGVRFVLLNSAFGSLRGSDFQQLVELQAALDDAAEDPAVERVVVMAHHPVDDPSPAGNSQLGDRLEARLLQQWLGDFEAASGKDAAYVAGHAGAFAVSRTDGVEYLVVGNTAKAPSTAPADGGFTGWVELGVDAGRLGPWLLADVNPLVDDLRVVGEALVAPGGQVPLGALAVQPDGREVPVGYPMSVGWQGESVVVLDGAADARPPGRDRRAVAAYDPVTGTLTGLRPGSGTLVVTTGTGSLRVPVVVSP
jgi:hypothetical protein